MCNLYSMTRNRDAIRRLFRVARDRTGDHSPLPAVFPDQLAAALPKSDEGLGADHIKLG